MPSLIVEQYHEQESSLGKIGHLTGRLITNKNGQEKNGVLRVVPDKDYWNALIGKKVQFPNKFNTFKSTNQHFETYRSIAKYKWVRFFLPKTREAFRQKEITLV
ncbi:hypothetical protein KGQ34_04710 [Patescibacteria group bacterium]|nr:hypothetical protein [Patescibacteria group bacterium]